MTNIPCEHGRNTSDVKAFHVANECVVYIVNTINEHAGHITNESVFRRRKSAAGIANNPILRKEEQAVCAADENIFESV